MSYAENSNSYRPFLCAVAVLGACVSACRSSADDDGTVTAPQHSGGTAATSKTNSSTPYSAAGTTSRGGASSAVSPVSTAGVTARAGAATNPLSFPSAGTATRGGATSASPQISGAAAVAIGGANSTMHSLFIAGATARGGVASTAPSYPSAGTATPLSTAGATARGGVASTAPSYPSAGAATPLSTAGAAARGGATSAGGATATVPSDIEFAPYFYTWGWGNTAYPFTGLADLKAKSGIASVTLAFVLSGGECAPTADILDHLSDVNAFQALGGHAKASFGGADGTYLENACADAQSLAEAIGAFVTATGITDLDFDVEQTGAMDAAVNARRAQALKQLQTEKGISVSFTLAAMPRDKWDTPGGLTASSLAVLQAAVTANVAVTRVNLMTMDYGAYYSSGNTMGALALSALTDANTQLKSLLPSLSDSDAWHMLGATPMIGQNDVSSETFTLDDARVLVAFAKEKHLGLVSFWAINRDQPCPYDSLALCSKVNTADFEFSDIFLGVK
jgi:hypothetical protein